MMNFAHCWSLVELPSSIGNLSKLKKLYMVGTKLEAFPTNINLKSLSKLSVSSSRLKRFPEISTTITELTLYATKIEEVPSSIMCWSRLRKLNMHRSENLKVFPPVPDSIEDLELCFTGIEEVPPSIQNLSRLTKLDMAGCKVKVLPTNINMESLSKLDLSQCTELKTFPEISKSIEYLNLSYTAIEEVPSSIWSWYRLLELKLSGCKNLVVFPPVPDSNQHFPILLKLHFSGCKNLVSLPKLPGSLSILNADSCESLERLEGSFHNPQICLNFANCFNLNQEARDLIEKSDCKFALLPGQELPEYYDHRAQEDFLILDMDQRPIPLFLRFKACLLLLHGTYSYEQIFDGDFDVNYSTGEKVLYCHILCIHNGNIIGSGSCKYDLPALLGFREHLYFFESSISLNFPDIDVNFNELKFEFNITGKYWKIQCCGVRLLEDIGDSDDHEFIREIGNETEYQEFADITIRESLHAETFRRRCNLRLPYYKYIVYEVHEDITRDRTKKLGACVLVVFLCVGILVYNRLEKFLILLLPILIYGIDYHVMYK